MGSQSRLSINIALLFLLMYFYSRRFRRRSYSSYRNRKNRYARTLLKKPQNVNIPIDPTQVERYKDFILRNNIIKFPTPEPCPEPEIPPNALQIRPYMEEEWQTPPEDQYLHVIRQPHHLIFKTKKKDVMYLFVIYNEDKYYLWLVDRYEGVTNPDDDYIYYYTPNVHNFNGWNCRVFRSPVPDEDSLNDCFFTFVTDQGHNFDFRLPVQKIFDTHVACEIPQGQPPQGWPMHAIAISSFFYLPNGQLLIGSTPLPSS